MNDLLSRSFSKFKTSQREDVEMATTSGDAINLDTFFEDVETVKEDLKEIDELLKSLKDAHEKGTTLHNANAVKDLRSKMDQDASVSLNKAKLIKVRLEALDRANVASRREPNCGPGSTSDRTRTSVVNGLRKKLKEKMDDFQELRERINAEYKETIQRRYFMVTGEKADDSTVERLISTGESETFLQKAIQEQGRGQILDTISEIQERHDGVMDMEKNLKELHQVFMDMSVLVQHQGEHLDDIEAQVHRANSFVRNGTEQLQTARKMQKSSRKWFCISIALLLVIVVVVLIKFHPWKRKKENKVAETNHILVLF